MSGAGYTDGIDVRAITFDRVAHAAQSDLECQALVRAISEGFPECKDKLPTILHPYWNIRSELTCSDGVPLYNDRVIVPKALRSEVLESLHSAHQGVAGMKARARSSVFWPNINAAISSIRSQCKTCNTIAPSQPAEPHLNAPPPEYPFQQVVADFFHLGGHNYLVYADRYSGWNVIFKTPTGDSSSVQKHLRMLFGMYGAPEELATDGGPPFNAYDFKSFLATWGVHLRLSSAYYAQSNGRAELAVKTSKRILRDNTGPGGNIDTDKVTRALLQQRNTPIYGVGLSPAQMLYGRQLRDCLLTLAEACKIRPEWRILAEDREKALVKRNITAIERYDEHTRALPELDIGDRVAVQNQHGPRPNRWEKTGLVVEKGDNRQYIIRMNGSGRCSLRNRRFLRKIKPVCADRPLHTPKLPAHQQTLPPTGPPVHPLTPTSPIQHPVGIAPKSTTTHESTGIVQELPVVVQSPCLSSQTSSTDQLKPSQSPPQLQSLDQVGPLREVRRSARIPKPRRELSMSWTGPSHDYVDICMPSTPSDPKE